MRPEAAAGEGLRYEQVAGASQSAQGPDFSLWNLELRAARFSGSFLGWGLHMTSGVEELGHPAPQARQHGWSKEHALESFGPGLNATFDT